MIKQYKLRDYNFRLVLFLVVLTFMGVLLVGSAEPDLQKKQFFGMMLGFIVMVIISLMDFSWILNVLLDHVCGQYPHASSGTAVRYGIKRCRQMAEYRKFPVPAHRAVEDHHHSVSRTLLNGTRGRFEYI